MKQFVAFCSLCDLGFVTLLEQKKHNRYKHNEEVKSFQCEYCGKKYASNPSLRWHRDSQHWHVINGTPFVKYDCTICNLHYTSPSALRKHRMSKHSENDGSVLCDTCGKRLTDKGKLKLHMRTHTGYKPHRCEICTKSFTRKEQLIVHQRVHTGEKPFVCKFCGKGFTQTSPLRIHERTHTGEKPYICTFCQKGYICKSALDTHMKSCS